MDINYIWVIGHLAFFLTAVSFLLKDIILLRFTAVVSSIVGIGNTYFSSSEKLIESFSLKIPIILTALMIANIDSQKIGNQFGPETEK